MMEKMSVCICGGGNLGLVCAAVFAAEGHKTSLLTGHPSDWSSLIHATDPDGKIYEGELHRVSADAADVIPEADLVFLCMPGNHIESTLAKIKPFLRPDAIVGSIVSSTGFFFFVDEIIPGQPVFGFQRTPFIARTEEYGRSALLLGYKPSVNIAVENVKDTEALRKQLAGMFRTPVCLLENRYEAALTNSNPILHTGRLYSMWGKGKVKPAEEQSLFYAEWTDDASQTIIDMDAEFMTLLDSLGVRKGAVPTLLEYYESADAPSLTRKIRSINAFATIKSPMKETPQGWMPDYTSRYFTEDFGYGLRFIKMLAERQKLRTPTIDRVYEWGAAIINSRG